MSDALLTDPVSLTVPLAEPVDGKYVRFGIRCKRGALTWMVYRRFNDFELLAKNLNSLVDKDSLPKLPPKKVKLGKGKFDKRFLDERRFGLEAWLQPVAAWFDPEDTPTLDDFLEYSENFMLGNTAALEGITELRQVTKVLREARGQSDSAYGRGDDTIQSIRESFDSDARSERSSRSGSVSGAPGHSNPLELAVVMLREKLANLHSQTEDLRAEYDGKLPIRHILEAQLASKRKALADTKQLCGRERVGRRRECESERRIIEGLRVESVRLAREIAQVQADIDAYTHTASAATAAFAHTLAALYSRTEGDVEATGVSYSVARGEAAQAYQTAVSGTGTRAPALAPQGHANPFRPQSLPSRPLAAAPRNPFSPVPVAPTNPFANTRYAPPLPAPAAASVTHTHSPFSPSLPPFGDSDESDSEEEVHVPARRPAASAPITAPHHAKATPPPGSVSKALVFDSPVLGPAPPMLPPPLHDSDSSDEDTPLPKAPFVPVRAASTSSGPEIDVTEPEKGVYVLPVCSFPEASGSVTRALVMCSGGIAEGILARSPSLMSTKGKGKLAVATPRKAGSARFWKKGEAKDGGSPLQPALDAHALPWSMVTGVCKSGEAAEAAAIRVFREKAVRLGAGVGLTAHALQKAVAGATFGSKTDVVVKGNDEGEPDVLRVSTMMTVQLHQQLSVSAQEPLRQSDDFHGVWVSLPELDEGVWTFVDEQTAMFVRLGLMLTGDLGGGDPAYDTKSTSSSSGRPDTHSASLPGESKRGVSVEEERLVADEDADGLHASAVEVAVREPTPPPAIPCSLVPVAPPLSRVGVGMGQSDAEGLAEALQTLTLTCAELEQDFAALARGPQAKSSVALRVRQKSSVIDGASARAVSLLQQLARANVSLLQGYIEWY